MSRTTLGSSRSRVARAIGATLFIAVLATLVGDFGMGVAALIGGGSVTLLLARTLDR